MRSFAGLASSFRMGKSLTSTPDIVGVMGHRHAGTRPRTPLPRPLPRLFAEIELLPESFADWNLLMSLRTSLSALGAEQARPLRSVATTRNSVPCLERRPLTVQVPEARIFMVADIETEWKLIAQAHGARLGEIHHEPTHANGIFLVCTAVATHAALLALNKATHELDRRTNDSRGMANAG